MDSNFEVVELINSLTKDEKRYFAKFSNIFSLKEKKYQILYDALVNSKYIEEPFKDKNFNMLKENLSTKILEAITFSEKNKNNENKIIQMFLEGKILQKKGLLEQSKKKFNKTIDLCIKFERFQMFLYICSYLKLNFIHNLYQNCSFKEIDKLLNLEKKYQLKIQNINILNNYQFLYYYYESTSNELKMNEIASSQNIINWEKYDTFVEKSICLNILSNHNENIKKLDLSIKFNQLHINLFEKNKNILKEYHYNYLLQRFNYISIIIKNNELELAEKYLFDISKEKFPNTYKKIYTILYYSNLLYLYTIQGNINKFKELKTEINRTLNNSIPLRLKSMLEYYYVVLLYNLNLKKNIIQEIQTYSNSLKNDPSYLFKSISVTLICFIELEDEDNLNRFLKLYNNEIKIFEKQYKEEYKVIKKIIDSKSIVKLNLNEKLKLNSFLYPLKL